MKKNAADQTQQGTKPFFARLLEAQELEKAAGGRPLVYATKKFPSDCDEAVTLKYPSDGDDDILFDK
ncbi:microviridin/marinostatin family tricyclic proteinase inhibitor [Hyalangium versicolor]|uniref:microviridin/marinostatin family tricyclic proteinase inhibitor n=1 Tax=Hyalangium versicolor TaxID=2861190 RepID=UPI001CD01040|nr:microviridin/marinostatin family tricyclic proteinase inhibitor [Hyalangium versicolor]